MLLTRYAGTAALATNDCSTTVTADLYCVDMDNAQCCRESRSLNILWGSIFAQGSYSLPIGVYGQPAPSPTLSLEWASPHRTLTAADLGMELQRSNESDTLYVRERESVRECDGRAWRV